MSQLWRQRSVALAVIGAVAVVGAWTFTHLNVTTEITHFLPEAEDRELARIAREMSSSDLNRSITLLVGAEDEATTIRACADLAERLEALESVEWVRRGPGDDMNQAFYELYFERRLLFYSDRPDTLEMDDATLREAARELKQRLLGMTGSFVRQIAPRDPLLAFPHHLERLRETQQGTLRVVDGQLLTEDGRGVVFLASRGSPFNSEENRPLADGIANALTEVGRTHGALQVQQSGVHRFAIASESAIKTDVTRISVVSSIGVVLLFLLLFRSPRYLLLSTIPLGAGFICGLTATQLWFGRIHGLSLAFGATLIGVAIDYVAHAVNHHTLVPARGGATQSVKEIWPGLALGAATTIAGLAGLAWTDFPGIRELAVLTSVGVLVALLATRFLLPPFMPIAPSPTDWHRALTEKLATGLRRLRGSRAALLVLPVLALLVCGVGLYRLEWVDDIRTLQTLDPALLEEDERVRAAVSRMDGGRFVIAWGQTEEEALQRNDAVHRHLVDAREAGELTGFRSLHALLWSAELQRQSFEALRAQGVGRRITAALESEGLVADGFSPFVEALDAEPPAPLTYADLAASPVGSLVRSFRVDIDDGRVAFVTLTKDADVDALEARLAQVEGVRLFDNGRFLTDAYGGFRTRTLEMIAIGLAMVFLMVLARYRQLGVALAAFLPAVLASASALALLVVLGYQANLMHLVALLLVLSMGVDYGVFMVESRHHTGGAAPTVVSLLVACTSTVLSFGLLAMSDNPALRALGLVTGVGVLLSLLLAPTAWLLLTKEEA